MKKAPSIAKRKPARASSARRGYGRRWRAAALRHLSANPLCVYCYIRGETHEAKQVDHIKPHGGDPVLFWDQDNWQGLCPRCHSRKTAREDGGFGHASP